MKKKAASQERVMSSYKYGLIVAIGLMGTARLFRTFEELCQDMTIILTSSSQLFTDYIQISSLGGALFNVGVMMLVTIVSLYRNNLLLNGAAIGSIGMLAGFSFFGKNLFNSIPIMLGVWLYTYLSKQSYRNYVIVGLFGTSLGPLVSFIAFSDYFSSPWNIVLSYVVGMIIGFFLPALTTQFLGFHQGFSLYNVGFTTGIIGMIILGMLSAFGVEVEPRQVVGVGHQPVLYGLLLGVCGFLLLTSLYLHVVEKQEYQFSSLHKLSGRLPSDFMEITNAATTTLNMALLGIVLIGYVYWNKGTLNGPVVGGIIGALSFGAFGNHLKNTLPVLLGILLGAYIMRIDTSSTAALVAAIFGTTLAPVSGYYGFYAGVLSGFIHIALVGHIVGLHGGLNLYNNGFAGGFIAAFLIPIFETFEEIRLKHKQYKERNDDF